ncbi:MAG: hypothetical protein ACPG88_06980, partial [Porticoccaceae bacterium]
HAHPQHQNAVAFPVPQHKLAEKKAITQDLIDQLEDKLKKLSAMHEILSNSWAAGHCLTANEISHLIDA